MPYTLSATPKGDMRLQRMEKEGSYDDSLNEVLTLIEHEYALVPSASPTESQVISAIIKAARDFNPTALTPSYRKRLIEGARRAWQEGHLQVKEFQWD